MKLVLLSALSLAAATAANPIWPFKPHKPADPKWGDCPAEKRFDCKHTEGQRYFECASDVDGSKFRVNQFTAKAYFKADWSGPSCCARELKLPGLVGCTVIATKKHIFGGDHATGMPYHKPQVPGKPHDDDSDDDEEGNKVGKDATTQTDFNADTQVARPEHLKTERRQVPGAEQPMNSFQREVKKLQSEVALAKAAMDVAVKKQMNAFEKWSQKLEGEAKLAGAAKSIQVKQKLAQLEGWAKLMELEAKRRVASEEKIVKAELAEFAIWAQKMKSKAEGQ